MTDLRWEPASSTAVPCVYCKGPISSETFAFWSTARRLVSADCPHCQRRTTLAVATLRRWLLAAPINVG